MDDSFDAAAATDMIHHHAHASPVVTKWQQLGHIFSLCVFMFVGAFGASAVPFYVSRFNQKQVKGMVAFGSGLLLCAALAVIIPEGVNTLYEHLETVAKEEVGDHNHDHDHGAEMSHHHHHHEGGKIVGWCLTLGFVTMFLVDNLACCGGMHMHGHSHSGSHDAWPAESSKGQGPSDLETPSVGASPRNPAHEVARKRTTLTLGLLIHSFADGIAVGAAKAPSTSISRLDVIVFVAIMMHKVPAAFGLSVFFKGTGASMNSVKKELLAFALAAPFGALLTFVVLHPGFLGIGSLSSLGVACCLLFSGGTFLYVATGHAMEELKGQDDSLSRDQVLWFCAGCILPMLVIPDHHH